MSDIGKGEPSYKRIFSWLDVLPVLAILVSIWALWWLIDREPVRGAWATVILVIAALAIIWTIPKLDKWFDRSEPRKGLRWLGGGLGVGLVAMTVAGFLNGYIGPGTDAPDGIDDVANQRQQALAYARGLTYAQDHGSGDEQWLDVKDSVTRQIDPLLGPRARIYPERNSHRNSRRDLAGMGLRKGRVVARMEVEADTRRGGIGYRKLRLPVGTSYLWIDNLSGKGDSVAIRAFIISDSGVTPVSNAFYKRYPKHWSSHARAHWEFDPNDVCICEDCVSHGHCTVCGT